MFDIGWGELFLIGVVALIVVGPKDLPALLRTLGNFTGKARGMAREFQRSLEQAANESGMSDVSRNLRSIDQTLNSATDSARKFAMRPLAESNRRPDTTPEVTDKAADDGRGPEPEVSPVEAARPPETAAPSTDPPEATHAAGERQAIGK